MTLSFREQKVSCAIFANALLYSLLKSMKVLELAHEKRYFHRVGGFTILLGVCARKCRCLSHAYLCRVFCECHC